MNIIRKFILVNKISKKAKAIKNKLDSTHVDESIKEHVKGIKYHADGLTHDIPEAKGIAEDIWEIIQK